MKDKRSLPDEPKLLLFSVFVNYLHKFVSPTWRKAAGIVLFGVTPDVPVTIYNNQLPLYAKRALKAGFLLALIFCFGGTTITTICAKTFYGNDPNRVYFIQDTPNLINYCVVAPLFVGFGCAFITLVLESWRKISKASFLKTNGQKRHPKLRLSMVLFVVFSITTMLTIQYIVYECLSPKVYTKTYWWIDNVACDGARIIGLAGVYYVLLNFTLLFCCLITAFMVFFHAMTGAEVASALREKTDFMDFQTLKENLTSFTHSYIVIKLFTATIMFNAFTWKWEKPQGSFNLTLMALVLSTIGVLLVSFPRYWVELEWYQYKVRYATQQKQEIPTQSDDLRDRRIRLVAFVIDLYFGVGFVTSFWAN